MAGQAARAKLAAEEIGQRHHARRARGAAAEIGARVRERRLVEEEVRRRMKLQQRQTYSNPAGYHPHEREPLSWLPRFDFSHWRVESLEGVLFLIFVIMVFGLLAVAWFSANILPVLI